jgi:hypothetical protein
MKKIILSSIALTLFNFAALAQNVNIPDANFKTYLLGNSAINTNGDTEIQLSEASAFTGLILGNDLSITDLTGVEAFTSLDGLYIRNNIVGSFDISANTALTYLDCQNTGISTLDISSNTALTGVSCPMNNLTSLDVSNNPELSAINCSNNDITSLDLSNNILLSNFSCDNNELTNLNLSNNTALLYFVCHFNNLTSLDLSNNTNLSYLSISGNDIINLDLSNNISLATLFAAQNNINLLDLSANPALVFLNCTDNDLSILNVANGNNLNFTTFSTTGNANLTCIQVDDDVWSTANWTSIDAGSSFSLDCNYGLGLDKVDLNQDLFIYPNPSSSQISLDIESKIISATIVDAMGNTIKVNLTNNTIDVSTLAKGVYRLQVETDKSMYIKTFIKN